MAFYDQQNQTRFFTDVPPPRKKSPEDNPEDNPEDHLSIILLPLPFTFLSRLIGTISWHKSKEKMTFWALFYILVVNFRPAQVSRTPQNQFRKH